MQISIIIPVFNEASLIQAFLKHLRERAPGAEIIVVDGASTDGTDRLAASLCDQFIGCGERSRATQMNAGARIASGDIFWFVHVDSEVPAGCLTEIRTAMQDLKVTGGYFRIRLPEATVYRLTDSFAHYAGLVLGMRCGDHGIFCRRTAFFDIGGFPSVPLMEDVEFYRRLRRIGRVTHSEKRIIASPRRYEAVGPLRLTCLYGLLATLYFLAVPLPALARIYQRSCVSRTRDPHSNFRHATSPGDPIS